MHRLTLSALAASLFVLSGCGNSKPPEAATKSETTSTDTGEKKEEGTKPGSGEKASGDEAPAAEKKDECTGFEIGNVEDTLLKSACEAPSLRPDTISPVDLKGKLETKITVSPAKVAPGGKVDFLVSFTNKSKDPLTLHFRIDPTARFEIEAFDAKKNNRVEMPAGKPPPFKKGETPPAAAEPKTGRVTLVANGSARARVTWEAVKTRWAPEKVRGTPPERGYPRLPAGPLPKGKYKVRVITPLVGVSEGPDREMTAPKVDLEIGG